MDIINTPKGHLTRFKNEAEKQLFLNFSQACLAYEQKATNVNRRALKQLWIKIERAAGRELLNSAGIERKDILR